MIEPVTKFSLARIGAEFAGFFGASVLALTITTEEMGVAITLGLAAVGAVIWLVRLEGRINTQVELLARLDKRVERMADHMGVE